jgi:penicillin-binding protein 1A
MRATGWVTLVLGALLLPGVDHRVDAELVPWLDSRLAGLDTWRPPTQVRLMDAEGRPFDAFALVRRTWVDLEDLPDVAWQAVVASEDRRFFDHGGVDALGILRAAWVNLAAGEIREGGSTLTQQLVKNAIVGSERSYARKLDEALLAWRLEQRLPKHRILELYLNLVYLGSGNYGIEEASRDYFGIPAAELQPGQAALLAGLVPAPSRYSPRRSDDEARRRRRLVLDAMVEEGFLDPLDAQIAKREPIEPPRRGGGGDVGTAFRTHARREVRRLLGDELPFQAGLTVHTAYRPEVQGAAEAAIREAAVAVEGRQGHPGALRTLDARGIQAFVEVTSARSAPRPGACVEAVHLGQGRLAVGSLRLRFDDPTWSRRVWNPDPEVPAAPLSRIAGPGDVFEVCLRDDGTVRLADAPWVEGAAAVVRLHDGALVAVVGGRDMPLEGFHRATQALRQAGSSFKPYVYAAALEAGWTQVDTVLDAPLSLPAGGGRTWSPQNYDGGFAGRVSMRTAFARSLNTVAVRLALDVGVDPIVDLARRAGVSAPLRRDLTVALGSSEVSVLDQAVGLATIARGGVPVEPVVALRLVDVRGREVGVAGQPVELPGLDLRLPGRPGPPAMRPATAWQMVELLRGVVEDGTARRAWVPGFERGGKTGTTSGYADAWFVGFTARHAVVTWVGRDDRRHLGHGETGGRTALPAWMSIVDALDEPEGERLAPPADVLHLPWEGRWVGLPADAVPAELLPLDDPGDAPLPTFPGVGTPCP